MKNYELSYDKAKKCYKLTVDDGTEGGALVETYDYCRSLSDLRSLDLEAATEDACGTVRSFGEHFGQPSNLRIRNRDGSFAKKNYTYPRSADPRRSKG